MNDHAPPASADDDDAPQPTGAAESPSVSHELLDSLRQLVGQTGVLADEAARQRYSRTTGVEGHRPAAVVQPTSTKQVQAIVHLARDHRTPMYPISRGCNWGYGEANAPHPGCLIIDLSRMNRIIEVDDELAYTVIEPGVSQGQLYDHLSANHPDLWMDATGAGRNASVVGNTLDRGFGHTKYGDHFATVSGMRIVLADGQIMDTGFGAIPGAKTSHVFPYGAGPYLDGLFCQSNFGIVTQLGLWLMPRPEAFTAFFFAAAGDDDLADLVDRLRPLRMAGLLPTAIHIGNDIRTFSARTRYPFDRAAGRTPLPHDLRLAMRKEHCVGAWNGCGGLMGSRRAVRDAAGKVKRALRGHRLHFVDGQKIRLARRAAGALATVGLSYGRTLNSLLDIVEPVAGLLQGIPSDEPLAGMGWRVRDEAPPRPIDPLETNAGFFWASPVVPMTGQHARRALSIIEPIYARHGFEPLITFTMLNERSMVAVTNMSFDRRQADEAAAARACYEQLLEAIIAAGYPPYRVGIHGYSKLHAPDSTYWRTAQRIKAALDPAGLMSPGRYIPHAPPDATP